MNGCHIFKLQYVGGTKISKVGHVTPSRPHLTYFYSAPGGQYACEI